MFTPFQVVPLESWVSGIARPTIMEFPSALSPLFSEPHYTKHIHSAIPCGRSHREQHPRNPYEFEEKTREKKVLEMIRGW